MVLNSVETLSGVIADMSKLDIYSCFPRVFRAFSLLTLHSSPKMTREALGGCLGCWKALPSSHWTSIFINGDFALLG